MWAKLETPKDTYHVIPVDDLKDHEQTNCWCKPVEERFENGNAMISHNAADAREFYEEPDVARGH